MSACFHLPAGIFSRRLLRGSDPGPSEPPVLGPKWWATTFGSNLDGKYYFDGPIARPAFSSTYVAWQETGYFNRGDFFELDGNVIVPGVSVKLDVESLEAVEYVKRGDGYEYPLFFDGRGDYVFTSSGSWDMSLVRVNVRTLAEESLDLSVVPGLADYPYWLMWMKPDGSLLLVQEDDDSGLINRWRLEWTGTTPVVTPLSVEFGSDVMEIGWNHNLLSSESFFGHDGKHYFWVGGDGQVACFDLVTDELLWSKQFDGDDVLMYRSPAPAILQLNGGNVVFLAKVRGGDATALVELDVATGSVVGVTELPGDIDGEAYYEVFAVQVSADDSKFMFLADYEAVIFDRSAGVVLDSVNDDRRVRTARGGRIVYSPVSNSAVASVNYSFVYFDLTEGSVSLHDAPGTAGVAPTDPEDVSLIVTSKGDLVYGAGYAVLVVSERDDLLLRRLNTTTPGLNAVGTPLSVGEHRVSGDDFAELDFASPVYRISGVSRQEAYEISVDGVSGTYMFSDFFPNGSTGKLRRGYFWRFEDDGNLEMVKSFDFPMDAYNTRPLLAGNKWISQQLNTYLNLDTGEFTPLTGVPSLTFHDVNVVGDNDDFYILGAVVGSGLYGNLGRKLSGTTWSNLANSPQPVRDALYNPGDKKIYCITGATGSSFHAFDTVAGTWEALPTSPDYTELYNNRHFAKRVYEGVLWYFRRSKILRFDLASKTWLPSMDTHATTFFGYVHRGPISGLGAWFADSKIYAHEGAVVPF